MRKCMIPVTLLLLLAAPSFVLWAQEAGTATVGGKPIAAIQFENLHSVSETELNGLMAQYLGKEYNTQLMVEIQSKLYALDYFRQVKPQAALTKDKERVVVTIVVEERPTVDSIVVDGNNQLRKGIILDDVLTKRGDLLSRSTVRMDEQNIVDVYKERGYLNVSVNSRVEEKEEKNSAVVYFSVEEGNQTVLEEIRFKGNGNLASDGTLKGVMETKEKGFLRSGVFEENKFQDDLRKIRQYYQNHGYVDVEIEEVVRKPREDKDNKRINLIITVVIAEGDQYTFQGIDFEGNSLFTDEELRESYFLDKGDVYNKQKFDSGYQRMSDKYYENGYIFNEIRRQEEKDKEKDHISFTVSIVEKGRAHIENIIIKGNTKTDEEVIRREIPLEEGDVFNKKKVIQGMRNLYNLQYFSGIEPETHQGSAQGLMDLAFNVEEGKTADILFGISFSGAADFPVSGQIKWTDRNFRGKGQTLGLESNFNPVSQSIALSFRENWLFGRRWQLGGSLEYDHKLSTASQDKIPPFGEVDSVEAGQMEYNTHSVGIDLSTGYSKYTGFGRFTGSVGGGSSLNYTTYDEDLYRPYREDLRKSLNEWTFGNRIWTKGVYDIRDYTYNPHKGFYLSETLTSAGSFLGGHDQYFKHQTRADFYWPLLDIPITDTWNLEYILKLHSVFSSVEHPIGGGEIQNGPIQRIDGMFIGRGWNNASVVLNAETDIVNPRVLWYHNAEIRMPISEQFLWWDTFLDAAALWDNKEAIPRSTYKDYFYSVGTGLRIAYRQFPLALYLTKRYRFDEEGWRDESHFFTGDDGLPSMNLLLTFGIDIF